MVSIRTGSGSTSKTRKLKQVKQQLSKALKSHMRSSELVAVTENEDESSNTENSEAEGDDEPQVDAETDSESSSDSDSEEDGETSEDESAETDSGAEGDTTKERDGEEEERPTRHIRPCLCDLSPSAKKRISQHKKQMDKAQTKFQRRKQEILDEIARVEEERLEKERTRKEQEELFADEYEMVGHKKKRKKRSARRASMVSLGVKQVINFRKEPKIKPHMNKVFDLRQQHHIYCGKYPNPVIPIYEPDFRKEPRIPVRSTVSAQLRVKSNLAKKEALAKSEDKRPPFDLHTFLEIPLNLDLGWRDNSNC